MPASTSRGYPYSVDTDPADIAGATQSLAEAVDTDVQSLYDQVTLRPAAKAWATNPQKILFLASGSARSVSLSSFQFNTGQVVQSGDGSLMPLVPGFWFAMASISTARPTGGVTPRTTNVVLFNTNSTGTFVLSRSGYNELTIAKDGSSELVCSGGAYCNGTSDTISMGVELFAALTVQSYTVLTRSLTLIRMTTV